MEELFPADRRRLRSVRPAPPRWRACCASDLLTRRCKACLRLAPPRDASDGWAPRTLDAIDIDQSTPHAERSASFSGASLGPMMRPRARILPFYVRL